MDKSTFFTLLRTDIGEEGIAKQAEQIKRRKQKKKRALKEQMRLEAEALEAENEQAMLRQQEELAMQQAEEPSGVGSTRSKGSVGGKTKSSGSSQVTPDHPSSEVVPEHGEQPGETEKPAKESMEPEAEPEQGTAAPETVDLFPEWPREEEPVVEEPVIPVATPKGGQDDDSRRMLFMALAVLALLLVVVVVAVLVITKPLDAFGNSSVILNSPCSSPGCVQAKADSDSKTDHNSPNKACSDFYSYSCDGYATQGQSVSLYEKYNQDLMNAMNLTLFTIEPGEVGSSPYRNLILFYRSCIDFHVQPTPVDERARKTLHLLDLSFTEWLERNVDSVYFFNFIIRLSLSEGINTIFKLSVVKKNRESRVVLEVGESIQEKLDPDIKEEDSRWRVYMRDAVLGFGVSKVSAAVTNRTLYWDNIVRNLSAEAKKGQVRDTVVGYLGNDELSEEQWMFAINDNLPFMMRLKNSSSMDAHDLKIVKELVHGFFSMPRTDLVVYIFMQAIAELLRYDYNRIKHPELTCLSTAYNNFNDPMTSLFAEKHVSQDILQSFRIFFENIKETVLQSASTFDWMDGTTQTKAMVKVRSLQLRTVQTSHQEVNPDEEAMATDFLTNYVRILRYNKQRANRYPEERHALQQQLGLIIGNVRVDQQELTVSVPATALLPPYYYPNTRESFVNLSTVGAVLAAEVASVAFTKGGSEYAAGGLKLRWWPESVRNTYNTRMLCYTREYLRVEGKLEKEVREKASSGPEHKLDEEVQEYMVAYTRGLQIAYDMASITDTSNRRLFFARFCQQFCSGAAKDPTPSRKSLTAVMACTFPLLYNTGFKEAYSCAQDNNAQIRPDESCTII